MRAVRPTHVVSIALGVAIMLAASQAAALQATLENVPRTPHGGTPGVSRLQLADAIKGAGEHFGWRPVSERGGEIRLLLSVRHHRALVVVGFDETHYWIDYEDSTELGYGEEDLVRNRSKGNRQVIAGPHIHERYNLWVGNLSSRIQENVGAIVTD